MLLLGSLVPLQVESIMVTPMDNGTELEIKPYEFEDWRSVQCAASEGVFEDGKLYVSISVSHPLSYFHFLGGLPDRFI